MTQNILEKCEIHGIDMYELSAGGVTTLPDGLSHKKALSSNSKGQSPNKKGLRWPLLRGLATKGSLQRKDPILNNARKKFLLPSYTGSLISRLATSHILGERLYPRQCACTLLFLSILS